MARGGMRSRPAKALNHLCARRAKLLFYALAAFAAFLVWRLFDVQVLDGPKLAALARLRHSTIVDVPARRGTIYDRNGTPLVDWVPADGIFADTLLVHDKLAVARRLAPYLDFPAARIVQALDVPATHRPLERKVPRSVAERIAAMDMPGIRIEPTQTGARRILDGKLAATVIGITGIDDQGLEGLEYSLDSVLRGTPGQLSILSDEFNRPLPFSRPQVIAAARPGDSVELTIDAYLQFTTERILQQTVAKWHARDGTAIVMDPNTGGVLAMANVPNFDPRHFERYPEKDRRDRAITDAYEPGSTFKLITAAAALESGLVTTRTLFPNRDQIRVGDRIIHNAEDGFMAGRGMETLGDIIAYSHNVGAAEVGLRIGRRRLFDTIRDFGFGRPTDIELPGESPGILLPLGQWSQSSLPTIAFGQGIAVTPLSMARAYCAIANGGWLLRPRILSAIIGGDGRPIYRYGTEIDRRVLSPHIAAILRSYLRGVVVRGTGNPSGKVAGYTTAGKTGTAQIAQNGHYISGGYVASFIGMIPVTHPRYVILVKVDRPQGSIYGSAVAAPAFAQIARAAMLHDGILPSGASLVERVRPANRAI